MGSELAVQNGAHLTFTPEQRQMIRDVYANGASDSEFAVFMEVARARGLNPITRQIHLVKRWNGDLGRNVCTPQTGIDGLRAIAQRTGLYDGQDEPEFEYDLKTGALKLAKVRVYRKDWSKPAVGVAHFSEYAQTKKDGSLTQMWATKGHIMIAKCAEALALRKAFPEDTSGLYTDDEMPPASEEAEKPKRAPAATTHVVAPALEGAAAQAVVPAAGAVVPGAIVDTELDPDTTAAEFIKKCEEGFTNEHSHKAWFQARADAINALPSDLKNKVVAAWRNAGPKA
jgi:phage recombination protein Bet